MNFGSCRRNHPKQRGGGTVHLVNLRTASGVILRPIQKIYPLELYDEWISKPVRTSA